MEGTPTKEDFEAWEKLLALEKSFRITRYPSGIWEIIIDDRFVSRSLSLSKAIEDLLEIVGYLEIDG